MTLSLTGLLQSLKVKGHVTSRLGKIIDLIDYFRLLSITLIIAIIDYEI